MRSTHAFGAAVAVALAVALPAHAQVFGQFGNAVPLAVDHRLFGASIATSSNQLELLGQLRLSFYPGVDFGFQGGFDRVDAGGSSVTAVQLGGDLKTTVARANASFPLDIALGGAIGVRSADGFNQLAVGPEALCSRTYTLRGGHDLTPYGGFVMLFTRDDSGGHSETDFSLPVRLGAEYSPSPDFRVFTEIRLSGGSAFDDSFKLALGANFPF